jgi:hypothetical protein
MAHAPIHYQRIGVVWDQFGTSNGSQCVTPTQTGSEASTFTTDVAKAEQLGETPLLSVAPDIVAWGATSGYTWPAGAQTPITPNDQQYECGMQLLLQKLSGNGLSRAGMPVEAFNEPDNSNYYVDPSQAGRYFGDLVATGGSQVHAIAGVFESAWDQTYMGTYVSAVQSSGYNSSATSWAVHDYNDTTASETIQSCSPSNLSACDHQSVSEFIWWLQNQAHEPTSDVWITESGDAKNCGPNGCWLTHSRSEEANTAYGWEQLRNYAQHTFWYQWQTSSTDHWDSALLNSSGQPRPSYCVIAYNETPAKALSDSRCPGS